MKRAITLLLAFAIMFIFGLIVLMANGCRQAPANEQVVEVEEKPYEKVGKWYRGYIYEVELDGVEYYIFQAYNQGGVHVERKYPCDGN